MKTAQLVKTAQTVNADQLASTEQTANTDQVVSTDQPVNSARPVSAEHLADVAGGVCDPEIDITLRDLGVLRSVSLTDDRIQVHLAPTRLGCPALGEIARRVRSALADAAPGRETEIVWDRGAWQPTAVTPAGQDALRRAGYRVAGAAPTCPYCGGEDVARAGRFGGAVCKVPYDCRGCGSLFDVIGTAGCSAVLPIPHHSLQGGGS